MAEIGINTFLWTTIWSDETKRTLAEIKAMGFDAVQMPILNLDTFDAEDIRQTVNRLGLKCYISAGLTNDRDITSENPEVRQEGIQFLKGCVKVARDVGSPFLSGSFHSVFGKKSPHAVGMEQWERSAEALRKVANEAQKDNLCLVLEPINRYESFLVNTTAQAQKLIAMIGTGNVKIQLDTFHMNIEENDFYHTIKSLGDDLLHFHVAENHRGRFGWGMAAWDEIFRALREIDYQGAIVIETFVPEVQDVAAAACIWRKMTPSPEAMAKEGLEFIRALAGKYGL